MPTLNTEGGLKETLAKSSKPVNDCIALKALNITDCLK